jgi:hypothetical protein
MSRYQCHNMPRPIAGTPLQVQDGWTEIMDGQSRIPRMITVPFVMSTGCNYDAMAEDKNCAGCNQAKESA